MGVDFDAIHRGRRNFSLPVLYDDMNALVQEEHDLHHSREDLYHKNTKLRYGSTRSIEEPAGNIQGPSIPCKLRDGDKKCRFFIQCAHFMECSKFGGINGESFTAEEGGSEWQFGGNMEKVHLKLNESEGKSKERAAAHQACVNNRFYADNVKRSSVNMYSSDVNNCRTEKWFNMSENRNYCKKEKERGSNRRCVNRGEGESMLIKDLNVVKDLNDDYYFSNIFCDGAVKNKHSKTYLQKNMETKKWRQTLLIVCIILQLTSLCFSYELKREYE